MRLCQYRSIPVGETASTTTCELASPLIQQDTDMFSSGCLTLFAGQVPLTCAPCFTFSGFSHSLCGPLSCRYVARVRSHFGSRTSSGPHHHL
mmetsp:Transcript_1193/g.739  ORF Transcript_1193/g.739 Transcript_1193/m.739 type:complete len:92 (+) Transcript_1193:78-353(+)